MSDEYPLFPELSEVGREEAQNLVNRFKVELKKAAEKVLSELYTDIVVHISEDVPSDECLFEARHIISFVKEYRPSIKECIKDVKRMQKICKKRKIKFTEEE